MIGSAYRVLTHWRPETPKRVTSKRVQTQIGRRRTRRLIRSPLYIALKTTFLNTEHDCNRLKQFRIWVER